jgi:hypothetical protein
MTAHQMRFGIGTRGFHEWLWLFVPRSGVGAMLARISRQPPSRNARGRPIRGPICAGRSRLFANCAAFRGHKRSLRASEKPREVRGSAEKLERAKGFEPSTPTLARLCSTPELRPRSRGGRRYSAERARHHSERARVCKRRRRAEPATTAEGISRACRSRSRRRRASDWRHRNGRPDRWRYCHRRRGRRRSAARGSEVS